MASFFEIGGKIFELENTLAASPLGNRSAKDAKERQQIIEAVTGLGRDVQKARNASAKTTEGSTFFHDVGSVVGFGVGMAIAVLTLPVTQADSPWPGPADYLWVTRNYQTTKRSVHEFGEIGAYLDETL
jgi:hypothetical protein